MFYKHHSSFNSKYPTFPKGQMREVSNFVNMVKESINFFVIVLAMSHGLNWWEEN